MVSCGATANLWEMSAAAASIRVGVSPICMGASALTGRHALAPAGHASAGLEPTHRRYSTGWEARDEPPNSESEATPHTSTLATPAAARELGRKYALRGRKSGSRNTGKLRINCPLIPGQSLPRGEERGGKWKV